MLIKRSELPTREDLVGQKVVCMRSWWCLYKVGEVYTISLDRDGRVVLDRNMVNGYDAEWEVIPLKSIEELL